MDVIAVPPLVVAVALVVGGVALVRRTSRTPRERVQVVAVVVKRTRMSRPSRITIDYPVPGGWRRATLVEGLPTTSATGRLAQPGDHVAAWVDPRRHWDVRLSPANDSRGFLGVLLVVMGVMAGTFALLLAVM